MSTQFFKTDYDWMKLVGTHTKDGETIEVNHGMLFFLSMVDNLSKNPTKTRPTCYASNSHFAQVLNISESSVSKYMQKLKKLGIIKTDEEREKGSKVTTARYIWIQWDVINRLIKERSTCKELQDLSASTCKELQDLNPSTCIELQKDLENTGEALVKNGGSTCNSLQPNRELIEKEYINKRKDNTASQDTSSITSLSPIEQILLDQESMSSTTTSDSITCLSGNMRCIFDAFKIKDSDYAVMKEIFRNACAGSGEMGNYEKILEFWAEMIRKNDRDFDGELLPPLNDIRNTASIFKDFCYRAVTEFSRLENLPF